MFVRILTMVGIALAATLTCVGCGRGKSTQPVPNAYPNAPSYQPVSGYPPVSQSPMPGTLARLNVTWRDSTGELQQLVAGMTQEEALALGLSVILTGTDWYAARVRLSNTGNVPLRIYPENIAIHFGRESAGVTSINHVRFLQRGVVQPGYYVEGLVMFRARVDIGAAIRLGGGSLSYNDSSILVTHNQ